MSGHSHGGGLPKYAACHMATQSLSPTYEAFLNELHRPILCVLTNGGQHMFTANENNNIKQYETSLMELDIHFVVQ